VTFIVALIKSIAADPQGAAKSNP